MRYEETSKRFRIAMSNANISQQELAEKSGIGKSSISHYVNGSNEPGNKAAYAIASVLKVNPAWLMGLEAPMAVEETSAAISSSSLRPDEIDILNRISSLNALGRDKVLDYISDLVENEKYIK